MMRVAVSIRTGNILPSDILRRLNSSSRKNKLYFGFRERGRVVRTIFLLRYLADAELRRTIQAATNKSERFNQFVQWVSFGGDSLIAENTRDEQRKFIKYNHRLRTSWFSTTSSRSAERSTGYKQTVLKPLIKPWRH